MWSRFQIENLISQDQSGVVFLGKNGETGEKAALRRFLRVGAIEAEDRDSFLQAIDLLKQLRHFSFRPVIEGGVDPVDGVPFIATEWVEGELLSEVLERGPFSSDDGERLVRQGLEVMELLETFFDEGANWVELSARSIVVTEVEEGLRFTFWLNLARWMGVEEGEGAVKSLANLAERVCGLVGEKDDPIKEWANHVREFNPSVSEARGALDYIASQKREHGSSRSSPASVAADQSVPSRSLNTVLVSSPSSLRSVPKVRSGRARMMWGMFFVVGMAVLVAITYFLVRGHWRDALETAQANSYENRQSQESSPEDQEVVAEHSDARIAAIDSSLYSGEKQSSFVKRVTRIKEEQAFNKTRTEFPSHEGRKIRDRKGDEIKVIGEVQEVRQSTKWFFFEFGQERDADDLCVILPKEEVPEIFLDDLQDYQGKTVHVRGVVDEYRAGSKMRVCLKIDSLEDLED